LLDGADKDFDAILLDIDNGPSATTDAGNSRIYTRTGINLCKAALRKGGTLAIWSAEPSKAFEHLLMSCGFHVRRYKVPAYAGTTKNSLFIWVAAESPKRLPPGGGEPRPAKEEKRKGTSLYL
jgi:spermidine synthase